MRAKASCCPRTSSSLKHRAPRIKNNNSEAEPSATKQYCKRSNNWIFWGMQVYHYTVYIYIYIRISMAMAIIQASTLQTSHDVSTQAASSTINLQTILEGECVVPRRVIFPFYFPVSPIYYSSHYPCITPTYNSSFHFVFHYPYIPPLAFAAAIAIKTIPIS